MSNNDNLPPAHSYDHATIEQRWQKFWLEHGTFRADDSATSKPKYYVLDMFPYPSGAGLHIGHPEGYTASDILARYKKANGFNVLHPMGWDAFGLPAEQYAIQTGQHPAIQTAANIANFRRQLQMLGFAIDWDREISTTDPRYFRWTQWIFLQLFKAGLAYVDEKPVWFCPALGTVLANEEVLNTPSGPRSERGSHPVERRPIRQWVLRITAYAEKLIAGLDALNWPDSTKRLQKNWIGRSEGAEVVFEIAPESTGNLPAPDSGQDARVPGDSLTIYTTRPDTLFGATYMVIAPEHPLVARLTTAAQQPAVEAYLAKVRNKSDLERTDLAKDKTGVFSGSYAINPVNSTRIPIWIADYVLMGYGTGAIMAVPAHDQRDWEFAKKFDLPIIPVVNPPPGTATDLTKAAFEADGTLTNSGPYDGLPVADAKQRITADLAARHQGKTAVNYKLRDWLFSRQRYWGEPFPIVWVSPADYAKLPADSPLREFLPAKPVTCKIDGTERYALPLTSKHLPLELPAVESYQPSETGESPLARATDWVNVAVDLKTGDVQPTSAASTFPTSAAPVPSAATNTLHVPGTRETNTMPQWAGSCWYYLRYIDPRNDTALVSPEKAAYWGTPDFYIGGAEHAVLHLLYARFWHRFLYDIGVLPEPEPFKRLFHQGIILGETEFSLLLDAEGKPRSATSADASKIDELPRRKLTEADVVKTGNDWVWKEDPAIRIDAQSQKMSKSRGNVVNPDEIVRDYGTDALRLYLMFLGPLEASKPWNTKNIKGISNFLRRIWRLFVNENTGELGAKLEHGAGAQVSDPQPTVAQAILPVSSEATVAQAILPVSSETTANTDKSVCATKTDAASSTPASATELDRLLHQTIKKVTEDIENLRFNTAISQLMIFLNGAEKAERIPHATARDFLRLLAPLAPHLAEELWSRLGTATPAAPAGISATGWPTYDPAKLVEDTATIVFQVNGKLRGQIVLPKTATKDDLLVAARADENVRKFTDGKKVLKEIVVPGKLVNIVVAG